MTGRADRVTWDVALVLGVDGLAQVWWCSLA